LINFSHKPVVNIIVLKTTYIAATVTIMFLVACSSDKIEHTNSKYSEFKDISKAPNVIQNAGNAVVCLPHATGVFVKYENKTWLMTNNHVLGFQNCAKEGCFVKIKLNYQSDKKFYTKTLSLIPKAADVDTDVAFFEISGVYDHGQIKSWEPPKSLKLKSFSANDLIDQKIHVVGHPRLSIKKWTSGTIMRSDNGYSVATALTVGGNSGSPVLNDSGEIVAIHHSSDKSVNDLTAKDFLSRAYSSPTDLLISVLEDGLREPEHQSLFFSTKKRVTVTEFLEKSDIYLNAYKQPTIIDEDNLPTILLEQCEAAINSFDSGSHEEFKKHIKPCSIAKDWFQCNIEDDDKHLFCLNKDDRAKWLNLSIEVQRKLNRFPGRISLGWVSWNIFYQYANEEEGRKQALYYLTSYLKSSNRDIDFYKAGLIGAFHNEISPSYNNIDITNYIEKYNKQNYYWYEFEDLIWAVAYMTWGQRKIEQTKTPKSNHISIKRMSDIYKRISKDEKLSVGSRLTLERVAYGWNVLD